MWVYNVVKAPVVGPRDFVIKIESAPRGADGSMTCAWHVPDDGVGPAALSGHVRLLKNSGGGSSGRRRMAASRCDIGCSRTRARRCRVSWWTSRTRARCRTSCARSTPGRRAGCTSGRTRRRRLERRGIWIESLSRRAGQRRRRQGARGAAPVGGLREDHDVAVGAAAKDGDRVGREGRRSEERERRVTAE